MSAPGRLQLFPPLRPEEYEALKDDISRRGVLVPVEIDADTGDVLDGHHRRAIAAELGIGCPEVVRRFNGDDERVEHVLALNLARRHLSPAERALLEGELRRRGWSYRRIASAIGVSDGTVRGDLARSGAQDYAPDRVAGTDGKSYPATRAVSPSEDDPLETLKAWLEAQIAEMQRCDELLRSAMRQYQADLKACTTIPQIFACQARTSAHSGRVLAARADCAAETLETTEWLIPLLNERIAELEAEASS